MSRYDGICPNCGHKNTNLFLQETKGMAECDRCGEIFVALKFDQLIRWSSLDRQKLPDILQAAPL